MKKEERFYERIVLLFLLAGSAFLYYNASQAKSVATGTDMASMDFPKGILAVLMVLCALKLVTGLAGLAKEKVEETSQPRDPRTLLTMAGIVVYAFFWRILEFCLSSFLFFFAESILLKQTVRKRQAALISAGVTLAVYIIFGMAFGVDFPEPLLELITG
ncbi:MAG: tripartite tricarboxylate transporter TctB family protein [Clostridium sp.]|nr:tripartite tricarboxylate transporter TctB family protein [Clostridium sp.]